MFGKKFKKEKLNEYPCDIYLKNALRLIRARDFDSAYSEICFAIIKSGGSLEGDDAKYFKKLYN